MPVVCHDRKSSIVYGNDRKSPIVYNVYEENYSQMKHFRKTLRIFQQRPSHSLRELHKNGRVAQFYKRVNNAKTFTLEIPWNTTHLG